MVRKILGLLSLTVILLSFGFEMNAQSYAESALLFSRTQPGGSARIQAMGGSQIALGGDYSSTLSNPAGLGMFNRSEFTITPAITSYSTTASFLGNQNKDNFSKFSVPGLSYVHHMSRDNNGFLGGSFGISMTRTNDFNSSTLYRGRNNSNSIVSYFIADANGYAEDQFEPGGYQYNRPTGLAYHTYLIGPEYLKDQNGSDTEYFTDAPINNSDQQENINVAGSTYQWSFSYGANFNDKIFVGGGIGLATLKYETEKLFSEEYVDHDTIDNMLLTENLDIRGSGINATFGVIARPADFIQIGLSFVTPTYYQLSETYDAQMDVSWVDYKYWDGTDLDNQSASTDFVVSDYSLTTPSKLSAGVAFISKFGLITGDFEMTNPGKAKYSSQTSDVSYSSDNEDIQASFKTIYTYRLGGEYRYDKFRFRAGYSLQTSPYQNSEVINKSNAISGGIGIRLDKFYADLAVISKKSKSNYSPYILNDNSQPVVNLTNKTLITMLTLGFTF